jgi:hypothetical protein
MRTIHPIVMLHWRTVESFLAAIAGSARLQAEG